MAEPIAFSTGGAHISVNMSNPPPAPSSASAGNPKNNAVVSIGETTASAAGAFVELVKHIVLITGAFLIIFAVAIGLDQLIQFLLRHQIVKEATPLEWALLGAKYAILVTDLALLGVLLYKFGRRAVAKF